MSSRAMETSTTHLLLAPCALSALLAVLLWGVLYWRPRRRIWKCASAIPGPKAYPVIGNAMLFWGSLRATFENLKALEVAYGPVVRLWMGDRLNVMILDPDDIQCVLGNAKIRNRDPQMTAAMIPFFGEGLVSNRDEMWRVHRRLLTPAFHFKILETYVEIFRNKADLLIDRLDRLADTGESFDVYDYLSLCTLDAICETAIGTTMNSQLDGRSDFTTLLYDATTLIHSRVIKPWLLNTWLYPLTSDGRKARPIIKMIKKFGQDAIDEQLRAYRAGTRRGGIETASGKRISSFLDTIIQEARGSALSAQEIQDEVTTMASAGLETTAATMSFLVLLLAIHPEVQEQVFAELSDIYADDFDREVSYEDVHAMPVLDRVLKETLRMYPIVAIMPRMISEDVDLPSGYTLPAGSSAFVMSYLVHRNPVYFPEPLRFWPDRWLPENTPAQHPYAYVPFSAGVRNCIGAKYAQLQMKTILATVLRRYHVTTDNALEDLDKLEISITLVLAQRYFVRMTRRQR